MYVGVKMLIFNIFFLKLPKIINRNSEFIIIV